MLKAPQFPATVEYGSPLYAANRSQATVLREGISKLGHPVKLVRRTAGYEPAGSCARYIKASISVDIDVNGTRHGKRYAAYIDARNEFSRITKD